MEKPKHQASTYLFGGILIEYNHNLVKVRWKWCAKVKYKAQQNVEIVSKKMIKLNQ